MYFQTSITVMLPFDTEMMGTIHIFVVSFTYKAASRSNHPQDPIQFDNKLLFSGVHDVG